MKKYRITEHICPGRGYILEYRPFLGEWTQLYIFATKTDAINGIERHKQIKSEYR